MLSQNPFYFQLTRKYITSFGNVFKDIELVKYNADTRAEISRRIVPFTYAPKENYLKRLLQQPELPATVEIKLPSMSFELKTFEYDATRKLQSSLQNFTQSSDGSVSNQYVGVPYNLGIELYIYIRNIDDGLQIVEQIIPFFAPDYTLTANIEDEMGIVRNVPIILDSVQMPTEYEGDATTTERRLIWQLNFTVQATYYGPISSGGLITETITNINNLGSNSEITLDTANTPLGNLALGEMVYQGTSITQANAVGTVISWNPMGGLLVVSPVSGTFVANANVHGVNFGSSVLVESVPDILRFATILDTPLPNTANNIFEDFGFTQTVIESPQAGTFTPPAGYNPSGSGGTGGGSGGEDDAGGLFSDAYNQANNAYAAANSSYLIATAAYEQSNIAAGNTTSAGTTTNNSPSVVTIDTFATSKYSGVKYLITLTCSEGMQMTEVLAMQDGINAYMTEYATLISANSLGAFSTAVSGSSFSLNYIPYNPDSVIITWKWTRQSIPV